MKDSERKQRWRSKKKLEKSTAAPSKSPFKTPQVKVKVMKRVRSMLTRSDAQEKDVLESLLQDYEEETEKGSRHYLHPETVKKV